MNQKELTKIAKDMGQATIIKMIEKVIANKSIPAKIKKDVESILAQVQKGGANCFVISLGAVIALRRRRSKSIMMSYLLRSRSIVGTTPYLDHSIACHGHLVSGKRRALRIEVHYTRRYLVSMGVIPTQIR